MKNKEKKVNKTKEETKKEVQTEEEGVQLTDEELSFVNAAGEQPTAPKE